MDDRLGFGFDDHDIPNPFPIPPPIVPWLVDDPSPNPKLDGLLAVVADVLIGDPPNIDPTCPLSPATLAAALDDDDGVGGAGGDIRLYLLLLVMELLSMAL